jgi:hypothetical protein
VHTLYFDIMIHIKEDETTVAYMRKMKKYVLQNLGCILPRAQSSWGDLGLHRRTVLKLILQFKDVDWIQLYLNMVQG